MSTSNSDFNNNIKVLLKYTEGNKSEINEIYVCKFKNLI